MEGLKKSLEEAQKQQTDMRKAYEELLAFYGENLNSTSSDVEFWSAIAVFVERFGSVQKAVLKERAEREEREARRRQREAQQVGGWKTGQGPRDCRETRGGMG